MTDVDQVTPKPTRFEPTESVAGAPFWAATRDRRYVLPWCTACERPHWFPREYCPFCLSPELEFREASGAGTVYAVSVMPKPGNPLMRERSPYALALVDLAEGVRVFTEIVGIEPEAVTVGLAVVVGWDPLTDRRNLPVFAPAP